MCRGSVSFGTFIVESQRRSPNWATLTCRVQLILTCNAYIVGFQVALQVVVTRSSRVQPGVGNSQSAGLSSRTTFVQVFDDVIEAADEAEIRLDALADSHATVLC